MPTLILQTVQQQVSHNHKVYLPYEPEAKHMYIYGKYKDDGLAGGEILTDNSFNL